MEKALREPLLGPGVEEENQEYSVWFLYLKDSIIGRNSFVPGSYLNRDFRKSDGTPVVDLVTYRKLKSEADAISSRLSTRHWVLYFVLVVVVKALRRHISVMGFLCAFSLALILFHRVSRNVLFKKADAELLALIDSYYEHFLETHGVTLHHRKCTKFFRWWNDDSGLYLRRPRTLLIPAAGSDAEESDGTFPPIYIHLTLPGNVYLHEKSQDASMKVDANAFALLQSMQKEMFQPSSLYRWFHVIVKHAGFVHMVGSIWFIDSLLRIFNGAVVLFVIFVIGLEVQGGRDQRIYQEITQRVNTALQKDENTAHLTLEYHDSADFCDRRYQFAQQGAKEWTVDPTNMLGPVCGDETQELSVWFMYPILPLFRDNTAVNPSYQNSDFRKSDGTPLVDPETYRKLKKEVDDITCELLSSDLFFMVVFSVLALAVNALCGQVFVPDAVGVYSIVLIFFHFHSVGFFQDRDAKLHALVTSYQEHFSTTDGVTLHHRKCTKPFRWWNDDSGLYLRRPRTSLIPVPGGDTEERDGAFSPIYIHLKVPGNVHIDEKKSHGDSINVDAHAFALLQSVHKESLQPPRYCPSFHFEINYIMFVFMVCSVWWFMNGFGAMAFVLMYAAVAYVQDERNQIIYHENTQRVNTALQKDENTSHLKLEYHDSELGNRRLGSRRYQFVQAAGIHREPH